MRYLEISQQCEFELGDTALPNQSFFIGSVIETKFTVNISFGEKAVTPK